MFYKGCREDIYRQFLARLRGFLRQAGLLSEFPSAFDVE